MHNHSGLRAAPHHMACGVCACDVPEAEVRVVTDRPRGAPYRACPKCYEALAERGVYVHHSHRPADTEWVHKPREITLILPPLVVPFIKSYCDRHHIVYKEG